MHTKGVEVEMFIGESNYLGGVALKSYPVLGFVKVAGTGVALTAAEVAAQVRARPRLLSHDRSAMGAEINRKISYKPNWRVR